jgi:flagellar biosynthesis/type III secretory pathway chaperone
MTMPVPELISVLDQETQLVKRLVEVLQADQQRVVKQDIAGLETSNREKEGLVLRLQVAEQTRRQLTERTGSALGLAAEDLRVSKICPLLGPEGAQLENAAEKLRAVAGGLAELVAVSRGFLEQSILGIRGMLSLIQSLRTPAPDTYDATGHITQPRRTDALAVRRQV